MKISLNGKIISADEPALPATNRGYRYGDGLFETLLVSGGKIRLSQLHEERLFGGLELMKYEVPSFFTAEKLQQAILHLCELNKCSHLARVRLSVSRGNGGLYDGDKSLQYIIECWPLDESVNNLNENGLVIDVCPDVRKSCDKFSNLKSASFQPYSIAALYAKEHQLNDCLVLNTKETIADSTIANLFIIKEGKIFTPSLADGCIKGVLRSHLIARLKETGYTCEEISINTDDLANAEEIFLTNAIKGIRWVRQCGTHLYNNTKTVEIYNRFIKTILH